MKKLIISLVVAAMLAVAYWLISPLFINKVVSEDLPTVTGYDQSAGTPAPEPIG